MSFQPIRASFLFLCSLCAVTIGPAAAQPSGGVRAAFVERTAEGAELGQPVSAAVRVTNGLAEEVRLTDRLVVPDGWRVLGGEGPFTVPAGGRAVRFPAVVIPSDAEVRPYAVVYQALDGETVVATDTLRVQLTAVYGVAIERDGAPVYTVAGDPFVPGLIVTNTGNIESRVRVDYEVTGPGAESLAADTLLVMGPGERRRLDVSVETREVAQPSGVRVTAVARIDEPGGDAQRRIAATTTVLPRLEAGALEYHRYPARVGVAAGIVDSGFGLEPRYGARAFASGAGRLGPESQTALEFEIRTPYVPIDEERRAFDDVYRLSLDNPSYSLDAGDATYRLSLLASAYGFGAGAKVRPGGRDAPVSAGAFYLDQRYGFFEDRTIGAEADLLALPVVDIGVNYFHKDSFVDGDYGSVTADAQPTDWLSLRGEVGYSENSLGLDGVSGAAEAVVVAGAFRATGSHFDYSPGYPSLAANRRTTTVAAAYNFARWLRLSGGASVSETGSPLGGDRDRATESYRVGADFWQRLYLQYRGLRRSSDSFGRDFDSAQDEVEARLRNRFGRFTAQVRGRLGVSRSSEFEGDALLYGAGAAASYALSRVLALSANVDYARGEAVTGAPEPAETLSAQATLTAQFSPDSRALLSAYATEFDTGEFTSSYRVLQGEVEHRLPWGHFAGIVGSYTDSEFGGPDGVSNDYGQVLGQYTVPLYVRTGRLQTTGLVSGVVAREATGAPLADVPVFVEAAGRVVAGTATNRRGEFFLPALPPGTYTVFADVRDQGRRPVLRQGDAVSVTVGGGEETVLRLDVVESAEIRIRTSIVEDPADDQTVYVNPDAGGLQVLANAVLELESDGSAIRTYTNASGTAYFGRLLPGDYTVRILGGSDVVEPVPGDSVVVRVGEGESAEAVIELRRSRRRVRFLNEEPVIIRSPRAPAAPDSGADGRALEHRVSAGETLGALSRRYYGESGCWRVIADANADLLPPPDRVEPGQVLTTPGQVLTIPERAQAPDGPCVRLDAADADEPDDAEAAPRPEDGLGAASHRVEPGETLSVLARRYYGSTECWRGIAQANPALLTNPDLVEPGTRLVLPRRVSVRGQICTLRAGTLGAD